jgi:porin
LVGSIALAQESTEKEYLTGNWNGSRDSLRSKGLFISPRITLFNHNFVAGTGDNESVFSGKAELGINYNGKQIGLSRWTLVTKAEYNFGNALFATGNVLLPKNTAITFPGFTSGDRFDLSSVFLIYSWKPGNQVLFGKINMVDLAAGTRFSGGAGIDAFWNLGFAAPASGITPPYILGAVTSLSGEKLDWTFMVYDPTSKVGESCFDDPFKEGVTLSVSPSWDVKIGNSTGSHNIRLAYSTQDGTNLYNLGDINLPFEPPLSDKKNRYYASYGFDQPLQKIDEDSEWGLFGQVAISDGNPNPLDWSFFIGIGGDSFLRNRSQDRWGLAVYNYSISNIIDDKADELGTPLRNAEFAIETFYQYWVTNWFSIGADVQVVKPIVENSETAVLLGLRSSVKL